MGVVVGAFANSGADAKALDCEPLKSRETDSIAQVVRFTGLLFISCIAMLSGHWFQGISGSIFKSFPSAMGYAVVLYSST